MQRVNLVSPIQPSGVSWVQNCLIELGIRVDSGEFDQPMFIEVSDNIYKANPELGYLSQWLPSYSNERIYTFNKDLEVVQIHSWPTTVNSVNKSIIFTRNPSDSLYSQFGRVGGEYQFQEFTEHIDPSFLLNRKMQWKLFHILWSQIEDYKFFFFEDYKIDPKKTLLSILNYLNLDFPDNLISEALLMSSAQKSREAELEYRKKTNNEGPVMNSNINANVDEQIQFQKQRIDSELGDFYSNLKANESALPLNEFLSYSNASFFKNQPCPSLLDELGNTKLLIIPTLPQQEISEKDLATIGISLMKQVLLHILRVLKINLLNVLKILLKVLRIKLRSLRH